MQILSDGRFAGPLRRPSPPPQNERVRALYSLCRQRPWRVMPQELGDERPGLKGAAMRELAYALTEAPQFDAAFRATFAELLAWRRDVRHFRPGEAPDEAMLDRTLRTRRARALGRQLPADTVRPRRRRGAPRGDPGQFRGGQPRGARAPITASGRELYARLKLAGLRDAPVQLAVFCDEATEQGHGLGARTMPETRRYSTVCALHTFWLAARARGLGVGWVSILDPAGHRRDARRSARLGVHRLSLRRLAAGGASDPGTRARRLAGARRASGFEAVGRHLGRSSPAPRGG